MDKGSGVDYASLLQFCDTQRQEEIINAIVSEGSQRKAAKALGINSRRISDALKRIRRNAAVKGYSPEHDMNHVVPDSFLVKGTSTLYDKDGNVSMQ